MILPDILANAHHQPTVNPLTVITSSSHSISLLPLIAEYVSLASVDRQTILVSALYDPRKLGFNSGVPGITNIDLTSFIPGFMDKQDEEHGRGGFQDVLQKIELAINGLGRVPVTIVIDSPATLESNFGSASLFFVLIQRLLTLLTKIGAPSQLILPLPPLSSLLAPLSSTTLYPTLNLLTLHPPPLLPFISQTYHLLPPPSDRSSSSSSTQPASKFFNILSSLTERHQADDPSCLPPDGSSGWSQGFVVELLIRSRKGRNGVGRYIEGVRRTDGESSAAAIAQAQTKARGSRARAIRAVGWETIEGLDVLLARGEADLADPSATAAAETKQTLPTSSFNLSLTDSQKQSRSTVPIPYAHEGEPSDGEEDGDPSESTGTGTGGIFYEPDEGDDMDEDDPDEDLEF